MFMRNTHPLLWHYVAAAVDESSAPGMEALNAIKVEDFQLADKAEQELVATGKSPKEIWSHVYEGMPSFYVGRPDETMLSESAELYCGRYIF